VRHLDADVPLQLVVVGQVDHPEATSSQDSLDAVPTDAGGAVRLLGCIFRRRANRFARFEAATLFLRNRLVGFARVVVTFTPFLHENTPTRECQR